MGPRLRRSRLEAIRKIVRYAPAFRDHTGRVVAGSVYDDEFQLLIDRLHSGRTIPNHFYRGGIDRDDDELLDDLGIMHLHLGGRRSDVLVFLIEYDDSIVILEINDHKHFRTQPVGSLLRSVHDSFLTADERATEVKRAERRAARAAALRAELKPRTR